MLIKYAYIFYLSCLVLTSSLSWDIYLKKYKYRTSKKQSIDFSDLLEDILVVTVILVSIIIGVVGLWLLL